MSRVVIHNQLEKSANPGSIIKTDALNECIFLGPGANSQVLTMAGGTPVWADVPYPSEFNIYADYASFPGSGVTDTIYYATAENLFYVWNGAAYVEVPSASAFSFTVSADSGADQTITNGNTLEINGANGFVFATQATDTVKLVPPTGTSGQVLTWNAGTSSWQAATPATTFMIQGDSGPNQTITLGSDTIILVGGTNISTVASATDTVTINMDPFGVSFLSDVDTTGAAAGSILYYDGANWVDYAIGTAGQALIVSGGVPTWTTIPSQTLAVAGDSGTNPSVILGSDTLHINGGTGITTSGNNGTDTITVTLNAAISDLSDVDTTGAVSTNVLTFNGTNWVDTAGCTWLGNFSIDCLGDTVITAPAANNILQYNGTNWVNVTPCAALGSASIDCLSDVVITAPAANQALTYNGANWVNLALPTGFITAVSDTNTVDLTVAGTTLSADVLFSASAGNVAHNVTGVAVIPKIEYFNPANGGTTVTVASAPLAGAIVKVYRNGMLQIPTTDWSIAGTTVTFVTAFGISTNGNNTGNDETVQVEYYV